MKRTNILIWWIVVLAVLTIGGWVYARYYSPTRILVVNALPAQEADIALNNDCPRIEVDFMQPNEMTSIDGYDAILFFGRSLILDSARVAMVEEAASGGVPIFTTKLKHFNFSLNRNISEEQAEEINAYFKNPTQANYRNLLLYMRHLATPEKRGYQSYELAQILPKDIYYHLQPGKFFATKEQLTQHLIDCGLYHPDGSDIALISGVNYPVPGNREHVDTLITRLTAMGYNVYPISANEKRAELIKAVEPRALIYLPIGRLDNDSLLTWLYQRDVLIYMPFPLIIPHDEWIESDNPIAGGSLNVRVLMPETAGALMPMCIATQNPTDDGYLRYCVEPERMNTFLTTLHRQLSLKEKPNGEKRLAVAFNKSSGRDALIASGIEGVPSLYNFLKALKVEGYDLTGLPATEQEFQRQLGQHCWLPGYCATGAQQKFMDEAEPVWIKKDAYEQWAKKVLLPEKYEEVVNHYGAAPGHLMARGDSLCMAALRYGNVLLFPQPQAVMREDELDMEPGQSVAPPHCYLAPYLYMQCEWDADALIQFGSNGNLEYIPGKDMALSQADWADVLVGARPYFYFCATDNVAEAITAKRRSRAEVISCLSHRCMENAIDQEMLRASAEAEIASMLRALNGGAVEPAPGGDPVRNPDVLPMGRNMHSINPEITPDESTWTIGAALADESITQYRLAHNGEFPQQVAYIFGADEFIGSHGLTLAQALRMLGVEPVRDHQGRIIDLRLTPSEELGRPRVNILVQVSGEFRDIAASRLMLLSQAVELASGAMDDFYPNYVAQSTIRQEEAILASGQGWSDAKKYSTLRIFGPINSGYATGMRAMVEASDRWDDPHEIADAYINNMSAQYGYQKEWGKWMPEIFKIAMDGTDMVVQPHESNTRGLLSLGQTYEYCGGLSLASAAVNGHEPDVVIVDYRSSESPRIECLRSELESEIQSTILNPDYIRERMKGQASSAQDFADRCKNLYGWMLMRPSALNSQLYEDLYRMYIADSNGLGSREFFLRVNPSAFQELTATMLECARKGYWKASAEQVTALANAHASIITKYGLTGTEFACDNVKLQDYVVSQLQPELANIYKRQICEVMGQSAPYQKPESIAKQMVTERAMQHAEDYSAAAIALIWLLALVLCVIFLWGRRRARM